MPDKYHIKYLNEGIIDLMIERMKYDVEPTVIMILKTLTRLATKSNYSQTYLIYRGMSFKDTIMWRTRPRSKVCQCKE
jgi:hypothetical protein